MNKKVISIILGSIILSSPLTSVLQEDTAFAWQVELPEGHKVEVNEGEQVKFGFLPEESTIKNEDALVPKEAVLMLKFNKDVSTEALLGQNGPKIWVYDTDGNLADFTVTSVPNSRKDEIADPSLYTNYLSINFNNYKPDTDYRIMMMPGMITDTGETTDKNYEIKFTSYKAPTTAIDVDSTAAYFTGYDKGLIKPNGAITRAEVAKVMQSVIKSAPDVENPTKVTDVEEGKWYTEAVNFVLAKGLLSGDKEGTFRPNAEMSREEFVTAIKALTEIKTGENPFEDVNKEEWSYDYIISAYENGIIKGYETGEGESKSVTFKPKASISRAEVATIINKVIGKTVDLEVNKDQIKVYEDLKADNWAYKEIITATIAPKS